MEELLKEISSKLNVIISLMLKDRGNDESVTIGGDARMLSEHGVSKATIAAILGSTERSIGEYIRPGNKNTSPKRKTKRK
jgi:hypothetical protein